MSTIRHTIQRIHQNEPKKKRHFPFNSCSFSEVRCLYRSRVLHHVLAAFTAFLSGAITKDRELSGTCRNTAAPGETPSLLDALHKDESAAAFCHRPAILKRSFQSRASGTARTHTSKQLTFPYLKQDWHVMIHRCCRPFPVRFHPKSLRNPAHTQIWIKIWFKKPFSHTATSLPAALKQIHAAAQRSSSDRIPCTP